MLASFYIQRQLSKTLGLSVNAEEIFTVWMTGDRTTSIPTWF